MLRTTKSSAKRKKLFTVSDVMSILDFSGFN